MSVSAKTFKKDGRIEIAGDRLRIRAETSPGPGGDRICIDARGRRGWAEALRSWGPIDAKPTGSSGPGLTLQTGRDLFAFEQEKIEILGEPERTALRISGRLGENAAVQEIALDAEGNAIQFRAEIRIERPIRISALGKSFAFCPNGNPFSASAGPLQSMIPHLRKNRGHVIADQIFRSPAAIIQNRQAGAALIPDLKTLAEGRTLPTALDLQLYGSGASPLLWYGFCPCEVNGHVFFKRAPEKFPKVEGTLRFGFYLIAIADPIKGETLRRAMSHLWAKHGRPLLTDTDPQTLPFDEYARRACGFAFERGKIWRSFDLNGRRAGGLLALTYAGPAKRTVMNRSQTKASLELQKFFPAVHGWATEKLLSKPAANDLFEQFLHNAPQALPPLVLNQAWFNNLRSAYGIYARAASDGDKTLMNRARQMKELALSAPGRGGLFCSVCYCPPGERPFWYEGTKAFQAVRSFHLPDNAWTGWWALNWQEDLENDARLEDRVRALCDGFAALQLPAGAIPGWAGWKNGRLEADPTLRESAQTAAPAMLMARFGRSRNDGRLIEAASRAARFLIENVFPENKWWDFETFFSCSKKDFGMRDAGTGLHCMNNMCIFWTAELMRELFLATGEAVYLDHGRRALDLLLMWQQIWNPPYLSIQTFGGFGVMNTDAEWNDARQSMFAETCMSYYALTGEAEHFERGVAALRASFTTALVPENRRTAPGNMGMFIEKDEGAAFENYAHMGCNRRAPGYIMFDWGIGGACATAARVQKRFGDIYANAARKEAFGINLCTVDGLKIERGEILLKAHSPLQEKRPLKFKIDGLKDHPQKWRLTVNGRRVGSFTAAGLERGVKIKL